MRNGFCVYDNMSTSHCLLDETQRPFQLEPWPSETKERPSLFCLFLSTKPTSSFFVGDPKFDSSIKKKKKRERNKDANKENRARIRVPLSQMGSCRQQWAFTAVKCLINPTKAISSGFCFCHRK